MALNVSSIGDNPQQPGITAQTYIPDQLIAGALQLVTQPIELAAGTLPRGSVLGQQTSSTVTSTSKAGGNTGTGAVGSMSAGAAPEYGAYVLTATSATNFTVTGPEGEAMPAATVATAYVNAKINFTIAAGGTAFVAGDSFTLTLVNTIGNFILSVRTASDGSQNPCAVLADYADASGGPVKTGAYVMGEFNANALNYDPSWTIALLTTALAARPIFVKATQGAYSMADPS